MRLPEQRLWDWLRERLQSEWFAERIENRVMAGTPDVYFAHRSGRGWLELKAIGNWPRHERSPLKIVHWTVGQRNWMERHMKSGGRSWLVVEIESTKEMLIMPDSMALQAIGSWTQDEIRLQTRSFGLLREKRKIDARALLDALR